MDRLEHLRQFGISATAARAYVALLDLGESEARGIARASRVPIAKVYGLLEQLQERGLVQVLAASPKRYRPVAFAEFLRQRREEHAEHIRDLERKEREILPLFEIRGDVSSDDRGSFVSVRGRRGSLERIRMLASAATVDLLLVAAAGEAHRTDALRPLLATAASRGVRVRVIARPAGDVDAYARLAEGADVRCSDALVGDGQHVTLLLADRTFALVLHYVPDDESALQGHDVGVLTNQSSIVGALRDMAETQWERAVPLDVLRRDRSQGRPAPSTRLYLTTRQGCEAIAKAIRPGLHEYLRASTGVASPVDSTMTELMRVLEETGARGRHLINVQDVQTAASYLDLATRVPNQQFRHYAETYLRFAIADREAFISVHRPEGFQITEKENEERDLTVHTDAEDTVGPLRADFERIWSRAQPLAERSAQLGPLGRARLNV